MPKIKPSNLTKKEIIKELSSKSGIPKSYISRIVEDIIKVFSELIVIKKISIKNFGTFELKFKNERIGRNPKTNELFKISSRKSLLFHASKNIKDKIQDF